MRDLVLVGEYPSQVEAETVAGLLKANGIDVVLSLDLGAPFSKVGGAGVQVAADDEQAARDVIASAQLEEAAEIGEDLDTMGEDEE